MKKDIALFTGLSFLILSTIYYGLGVQEVVEGPAFNWFSTSVENADPQVISIAVLSFFGIVLIGSLVTALMLVMRKDKIRAQEKELG